VLAGFPSPTTLRVPLQLGCGNRGCSTFHWRDPPESTENEPNFWVLILRLVKTLNFFRRGLIWSSSQFMDYALDAKLTLDPFAHAQFLIYIANVP
jgi:hypothetical protein